MENVSACSWYTQQMNLQMLSLKDPKTNVDGVFQDIFDQRCVIFLTDPSNYSVAAEVWRAVP